MTWANVTLTHPRNYPIICSVGWTTFGAAKIHKWERSFMCTRYGTSLFIVFRATNCCNMCSKYQCYICNHQFIGIKGPYQSLPNRVQILKIMQWTYSNIPILIVVFQRINRSTLLGASPSTTIYRIINSWYRQKLSRDDEFATDNSLP